MNQEFKWAYALGIALEQLEHWCQGKQPHQPAPFFLMLHKHLDESAYLQWARKEYGLASLDQTFFKTKPDPQIWFATKIEYQWSPWLLPLKIWDDTLFVGCVEPPEKPLQLSLPVHYILCPATGLDRLWNFYMSQMGVDVTQKSHLTDTPVEKTASPIHAQKPESSSELPQPSSAQPPHPPSEPQVPKAAPVQPQTQTATLMQQRASKAQQPVAEPATFELSFDFSNLTLNKTDEDEFSNTIPISSSDPQQIQVPPPPQEPEKPQVPPSPPNPTFSGTVARFELKQPENSFEIRMPPPPSMSAPAKTTPTPNLQFKTTKVSSTLGAVDLQSVEMPPSLDVAKNFDQVIAYSFKEMSNFYDKCLFASYQGSTLKIKRWTSNLQPAADAIEDPLPLDRPNMFKIANDTKKPFHGPVSINEINQKFFKNWTGGQVPKIMTIFPVFDGQKIIGHLIGMASQQIDLYASIEAMNSLAEKISKCSNKLAA